MILALKGGRNYKMLMNIRSECLIPDRMFFQGVVYARTINQNGNSVRIPREIDFLLDKELI